MSKVNKELLSDLGLSEDEDIENEVDIDDEVDDSDEEPQNGEQNEKNDSEDNENDNEEDAQENGDDEEDENEEQEQQQKFDKKDAEYNKMKLAIQNKNLSEKDKQKMIEKVEEYNKKQLQKGVCYLSRIPPYMKATFIRKLLQSYGVERIYLAAEDDRKRKMRMKNGGNKKRCYTEGWVEFTDKRIAKRVALSLNCTKMVQKTRSFYGEDLWNIKYLPKFKWDNLTERLAYQNRVRKEKLQQELQISKKEQDFYRQQLDQSKKIQAVEKRKQDRNQTKAENIARRTFLQRAPTKKIHNAQSDHESDEE